MIENDVYFLIVVIDLQNLYYFHVKSIREGILSKCAQLEASDGTWKKSFIPCQALFWKEAILTKHFLWEKNIIVWIKQL